MRFCGVSRRPHWSAFIKSDPGFALRLFSAVSERLRQSDEVIESLLHREVSPDLECRPVFDGEQHDGDEWEGFAA
jgi:hypothetical protein